MAICRTIQQIFFGDHFSVNVYRTSASEAEHSAILLQDFCTSVCVSVACQNN